MSLRPGPCTGTEVHGEMWNLDLVSCMVGGPCCWQALGNDWNGMLGLLLKICQKRGHDWSMVDVNISHLFRRYLWIAIFNPHPPILPILRMAREAPGNSHRTPPATKGPKQLPMNPAMPHSPKDWARSCAWCKTQGKFLGERYGQRKRKTWEYHGNIVDIESDYNLNIMGIQWEHNLYQSWIMTR